MNWKILIMILFYYGIFSALFLLGNAENVLTDFDSSKIKLNDSNIQNSEIDKGGLFGTGVSFGRYIGFVFFGIGLPPDTANFFIILFAIWQSIITIISITLVITAIWNG